jgi:outer membrane biosynthesis protein TonB
MNQKSQAGRLVVQTISLDPSNLLAVDANPLRPNRIPPTRLEPNRITPTPIPAVPLEHKTMSPPRQPQPSTPPTSPSNPNENIKTTITPPQTPSSPSEAKKTPANPPNKSPLPQQKTPVQHTKPVPKKEIKPPAPAVKKPAATPHAGKTAVEKAAEEKKKVEQEAAKKKETQLAEQAKQEKERQQKLVAAAQERIAKINAGSDKVVQKNTNLTSVNAITNLQIDSLSVPKGVQGLGQREMSYRDELASRLKLLLRLPEYGDVKVDLTIDRMGKVVKIAIVSAESVVNRKYIEKTLPEVAFPAFGTNYETAAEYTFTVTLSNA